MCINKMNKIILILESLLHLTVQIFLYVDTFSKQEVGLVFADLRSVQCSVFSGKVFNSLLAETNANT